jgi:hypothetical protein
MIQSETCLKFQDTRILATKTGRMEHIIREAIQIQPHSDNMKREEGFSPNKSWTPLLQILKERRKFPCLGKVTYDTTNQPFSEFPLPHYTCETDIVTDLFRANLYHPPHTLLWTVLVLFRANLHHPPHALLRAVPTVS